MNQWIRLPCPQVPRSPGPQSGAPMQSSICAICVIRGFALRKNTVPARRDPNSFISAHSGRYNSFTDKAVCAVLRRIAPFCTLFFSWHAEAGVAEAAANPPPPKFNWFSFPSETSRGHAEVQRTKEDALYKPNLRPSVFICGFNSVKAWPAARSPAGTENHKSPYCAHPPR